jgi:four helix bundle protein
VAESHAVGNRDLSGNENLPIEERYGLTNQLRRAAVSVPSNIAEGQARFSSKDFHRFLGIARGSLVEIETQVEIAKSLGYLTCAQTAALRRSTAELGRVLNAARFHQDGCLTLLVFSIDDHGYDWQPILSN